MSLAAHDLAAPYQANGVVSPVRIVAASEAASHRRHLEDAEAVHGPMHYIDKVHTVSTSVFALATHPSVLDAVEQFIGPDILLYNATYIIKEPGSAAHVAWHQDLTYWGLSDDDAQVSMWLALAPATTAAGCMHMIPGSHRLGLVEHSADATTRTDGNVLLKGQNIATSLVDIDAAVAYPLDPGEASFHHGWTIHASSPNVSSDRRIGLNVQYLAPHVRVDSADPGSAILVRGTDRYGNFGVDVPPASDFAPDALAAWRVLDQKMKDNFQLG